MLNVLLVALGGGLGAAARFGVSLAMPTRGDGWPVATFLINVSGSLAIGVLASWLATRGDAGEQWRLFLGVGVLGGFTTFSAFGLESWGMIERGAYPIAALYITASVVGAVLLTGLGLWITQR